MTDSWQQFLSQEFYPGPARTPESQSAQYRRLDSETVVAQLTDLTRVKISGADAGDFLHAQLTSDVEALVPGSLQPTAWLNPQGRILTIATLLRRSDHFELLLPQADADPVLKRLKMFVLRAKVTFEPIDSTDILLGVAGIGAEGAVREHFGLSDETGEPLVSDAIDFWRWSGTAQCFVLRVPIAEAIGFVRASGVAGVELPTWVLAKLRDGVPTLPSDIAGRYIPQMLNLDMLGAVSFTKGCYPGQEIVARTQYRGRLKRRLCRATIVGDEVPPPMVGIYATSENPPSTSEPPRKAGEIIQTGGDRDGHALVVANVDRAPTTRYVIGEDGHTEICLQPIAGTDTHGRQN